VVVKVTLFPLHPELHHRIVGEAFIDLLITKMFNEGIDELPWGFIICQERPTEWQVVDTGIDNTHILLVHPHLRVINSRDTAPQGSINQDAMNELEKCLYQIAMKHGKITDIHMDDRSEWLQKQKTPLLHRVNMSRELLLLTV